MILLEKVILRERTAILPPYVPVAERRDWIVDDLSRNDDSFSTKVRLAKYVIPFSIRRHVVPYTSWE